MSKLLFKKEYPITSGFGPRTYWLDGKKVSDIHDGIDFGTPVGTELFAPENMTILQAFVEPWGALCIEAKGESGYTTVYAHLRDFAVKDGDKVKKGQLIGHTGESGRTTGPHLHFVVLINNNPIDGTPYVEGKLFEKTDPVPTNYIRVQEGWGLSHVAKEAGFSDWTKQSRWTAILDLNPKIKERGGTLYPGDLVKVKGDKVVPPPPPKPKVTELEKAEKENKKLKSEVERLTKYGKKLEVDVQSLQKRIDKLNAEPQKSGGEKVKYEQSIKSLQSRLSKCEAKVKDQGDESISALVRKILNKFLNKK